MKERMDCKRKLYWNKYSISISISVNVSVSVNISIRMISEQNAVLRQQTQQVTTTYKLLK